MKILRLQSGAHDRAGLAVRVHGPTDFRAPDWLDAVIGGLHRADRLPLQLIRRRAAAGQGGIAARVIVEIREIHVRAVAVLVQPGHVTLNVRRVDPPHAEHADECGRGLRLDRQVAGFEDRAVVIRGPAR